MPNIPQITIGNTTYKLKDTDLRDDYTALSNAISNHDSGVYKNTNSASASDLSLTWADNETVTISGTNSSATFSNLVEGSLTTLGVNPGDTLIMNIEKISGSGTPSYRMYWWEGGESYAGSLERTYSDVFTIPSNTTKLVFRLQLSAGTWNCKIRISLQKRGDNLKYPNDWYTTIYQWSMSNGADLDNYTENGVWLMPNGTGISYTHYPFNGEVGVLAVYKTANVVTQICFVNTSTEIKFAHRWALNGTWRDWGTFDKSYTMRTDSTGYGGNQSESTDLNALLGNQIRLLNDSYEYTNKPVGMTLGFIACIYTGNWHLQLAWQFTGGKMWKRRGNSTGSSWEQWTEISGGGGNTYNVTNNYEFPEYSQTVNLTASPQITADSNNYLAPTGDTADRTADILAMLNASGICRLGPGDYYVKNLVMPNYSSIMGSGFTTKIRLSNDNDATFAIAPKSHCIVKDLRILGGTDGSVVPSATVGTRHGILWQGEYTESQTAPVRSILENLFILNFSGGGITCYDTGYGTINCIEANNIYIATCSAGLNVSYWSEFLKFTNVRCSDCYYGCINNGGNNMFVNCDFSSNREIAMLIDNSQGQSPNNTHGSAIGCVFNHTAHNGTSNTGIGIKILNCHSGFIFDGCQIFYSQIYLEDTDGIVVSNTNFGNSNCNVTINNGGTILFTGCMVEGAIPITVSNNQKVHFVNCYNKATGASWAP